MKKYAVIAYYDSPYGEKGTIISKHKNYELAEKAAAAKDKNGWLGIIELRENVRG